MLRLLKHQSGTISQAISEGIGDKQGKANGLIAA
jgi:hypothetical protein